MKAAAVFLSLVVLARSASFPGQFKKCNRKDADVDKCYVEAAQDGIRQLDKGIPEVNLPTLSPLLINQLQIGAGAQGVVNVNQNFKNCKLYGLTSVDFTQFNVDFDKKKLNAAGFAPQIRKECEYELNGKVLLLPIVGTGPSNITLENVKLRFESDFEEVAKKSKSHLKFSNSKLDIDPDNVVFHFENLFNGDKPLGDNINKVLNENQKEVFADVKSGYENALALVIQQLFNNFFAKISVKEAFD